mgnify:CR=1 FL=1
MSALRRNGVEFVEKENAWLRCRGPGEHVAHALLRLPNVLIQELWAFHTEKVEPGVTGKCRNHLRLATPRVAKKKRPRPHTQRSLLENVWVLSWQKHELQQGGLRSFHPTNRLPRDVLFDLGPAQGRRAACALHYQKYLSPRPWGGAGGPSGGPGRPSGGPSGGPWSGLRSGRRLHDRKHPKPFENAFFIVSSLYSVF